jgi:hypothetical protein
MSPGESEEFESEHRESLRARFVIDRIDGRPVLAGHARCPHCDVKLRRDPQGRMDLGETAVRIECKPPPRPG